MVDRDRSILYCASNRKASDMSLDTPNTRNSQILPVYPHGSTVECEHHETRRDGCDGHPMHVTWNGSNPYPKSVLDDNPIIPHRMSMNRSVMNAVFMLIAMVQSSV